MAINANVSFYSVVDDLRQIDKILYQYIHSFLEQNALFRCFSSTEEQFLQNPFHLFRRSVWKQKLRSLNRKDLCQWPDFTFTNPQLQKDWQEQLFSSWQGMLKSWPTSVFYLPEGITFSKQSFQAFLCALVAWEEEQIQEGFCPRIQLFLSQTGLDDESAESLAQALNRLQTVSHLDLKQNQISSKGARALSKALKASASLEVLDLHGNPICEKGSESLASMLLNNRSLKFLSLNTESITAQVAKIFEAVRAENSVIEELDIWR